MNYGNMLKYLEKMMVNQQGQWDTYGYIIFSKTLEYPVIMHVASPRPSPFSPFFRLSAQLIFDRGGKASANAEQTPDSIWRHRDFVLIPGLVN